MPNEAYFSNICPKSDQEFLGIPLLVLDIFSMTSMRMQSIKHDEFCLACLAICGASHIRMETLREAFDAWPP